jgi:hypothetical protein
MHSDCPSVLPAKDHRAFGTYRLTSQGIGTAFRSAFSPSNVLPSAYPIQKRDKKILNDNYKPD